MQTTTYFDVTCPDCETKCRVSLSLSGGHTEHICKCRRRNRLTVFAEFYIQDNGDIRCIPDSEEKIYTVEEFGRMLGEAGIPVEIPDENIIMFCEPHFNVDVFVLKRLEMATIIQRGGKELVTLCENVRLPGLKEGTHS
jgi:hypothetical protein